MKYKVLKQKEYDERLFELQDENGYVFNVDFYTDGAFPPPVGVDETPEKWKEWLRSFVGKTLEIEKIIPYTYFSSGVQKIVPSPNIK